MSFFTALNALYLQSFGLGMNRIGLIGTIAMIPFVVKIFLGMLSDKVNFFGLGYRKPYIVVGLIVQALCLVAAPLINPGNSFSLYAGLALIMMMGMALYDTCTDGLALDSTPAEEEAKIQGFMVGGRAAGMLAVSSLLGVLVENISWSVGFYFLALVTLLPLPLVILSREPERTSESRFEWRAFRAFTRRNVIALGTLGALYSLIIYGANQLVNPYLSEIFNINLSTAGFIATMLGAGIVVGGLMGGRITSVMGQKKSVRMAVLVSMISIGMLTFINSIWMAWALVFIFGTAFGFYETVYFAVSMRVTDGRIAATMFSILMAVANIGTGIGLGITGALSESIGFRLTFIALAGLNVFALPLNPLIFGAREENVFAD